MSFKYIFYFILFISIPVAAEILEGLEPEDTISQCVDGWQKDGVYAFRPNCKEWVVRSGNRIFMKYNSLGLRDKEFTAWPKKGWKRVLILGGSAIVGPGIEETKGPVPAFEKIAQKLGGKIEMINAGVEGYSVVHSAVKFKSFLEAYHPTHVLLFTNFFNTMNFDLMYGDEIQENPDESLVLVQSFGYFINEILGYRKKIEKDWKANIGTANSLKYFSKRARRFIYCKARYRTSRDQLECVSASTLHLISYINKISLKNSAKFITIFPEREYSNDKILVNLTFNKELANFLDKITPAFTFSAKDVSFILTKHDIPHALTEQFSEGKFFLSKNLHLSENGSMQFGENLWNSSKSFLRDGP